MSLPRPGPAGRRTPRPVARRRQHLREHRRCRRRVRRRDSGRPAPGARAVEGWPVATPSRLGPAQEGRPARCGRGPATRLHLLRGPAQGQARRRVELAAAPRGTPRGLLDHEVGHEHLGRHRGPRRRPAPRRPGLDLRAAVARHRVGVGDGAQPALQRQRPLLVAPVGLRRPARGPEPHEVRRLAPAAVRPRQRLGLQQRRDPGPRAGAGEGDRDARREVRPGAPVRAARHDPVVVHHRPCGRRRRLLRPPHDVPRHRPARPALPRQREGRGKGAASASSTRPTSGTRSGGPRRSTTRPTATCGGSTGPVPCAARPTRSTPRGSRCTR